MRGKAKKVKSNFHKTAKFAATDPGANKQHGYLEWQTACQNPNNKVVSTNIGSISRPKSGLRRRHRTIRKLEHFTPD
jgi:hypothetical protein